jgi:indole-3-glycerol phosphate synthase
LIQHGLADESSDTPSRPEGVLEAGGTLDRIVLAKAQRLRETALNYSREAQGERKTSPAEAIPQRGNSFYDSISRPDRINIIAEIKRRSPSKGIIREDFDPVAIAPQYITSGAAALSILTEEDFFDGSLEYLKAIHKQTINTPLLRKDFIFDESQLVESKLAGADAVLLITAILDDPLLRRLLRRATKLGLDTLVEVHTREELNRAMGAEAKIIGVNNRDLKDFTVSLDTSLELGSIVTGQSVDMVLVSESGIATAADIALLRSAGFSAFLIGEHFMRAPEPGAALASLIEAAAQAQANVAAGEGNRA